MPQAANMPISREPMSVPLRSTHSPRAMSEPAKETNWPGATARRTSMAGPSFVSTSSVHSIMTTASAPRGTTPPVAMAVARAGHDRDLRLDAAGKHLAIEDEAARRAVARARRIARAQGEAVDRGAVERRGIDGCGHIGGEHPAECGGKRNFFSGERRKIERAGEAIARFLGRDDLEELLLERRPAYGVEQRGGRMSALFSAHGKSLISTIAPAG